jgi:hypothetical protein
MKKSELKQLIREELEKELSRRDKEAVNKYMTGEEILWIGTRVEVVKDDGGPTLTVIKPKGREGMVFRKDTKSLRKDTKSLRKDTKSLPLNESPYPLTTRKHIIAKAIENSDIPDEEFEQSDKYVVADFIQKGNPSEPYLEKIMGILKKHNVEVEFPPLTPLPDRSIEDIEDFNAILSKYLK